MMTVRAAARAISDATGAVLGWIGHQGTRAMTVSLFLGVALPPLAALAKPLFTPVLFALIVISFLRVDPDDVARNIRRPALVALATFWTLIGMPVAIGFALMASNLSQSEPGHSLAFMLQAVAPPTNSSVGLSAMIGLDPGFALVTLLASSAIVPFSAPPIMAAFGGPALSITPLTIGAQLWGMIAGAAAIAFAVRWLKGGAWVMLQKERLDGANVICVFVFAVALMDNVFYETMARPGAMAGLVGIAFAVWIGLFVVTTALFWPAGRMVALTIAFMTACHNTGLTVATAGTVPDIVWLYFAMLQFPIYLAPQSLKVLLRWLRLRET